MDVTMMKYSEFIQMLSWNEEPAFMYKDIRCDISYNNQFRFLTQGHGYNTIEELISIGEINGKHTAVFWDADEIRRKINIGEYLLADYGDYQYHASYGGDAYNGTKKFRFGYTQIFGSLDKLLEDGLIDGRHIKEIWDEFEANNTVK